MTRRATTEEDYTARIDRVIDHVYAHYADPLPLDALARVAHFSPFHFHRVFRAHTGETLRAFVTRVRVQRAALQLGRGQTRTSLLELALACGFGSASELSRAFREAHGVSPSAFRRHAQMRKNAQEPLATHPYLPRHERQATKSPLRLKLVERPRCHLAYIRVQNPFAEGRLAHASARLDAYAAALGLNECARVGLSMDDPALLDASKTRYDLAWVTQEPPPSAPGISCGVLSGGLYGELAVCGSVGDLAHAWDRLFAEFLPASGYEPADGPGIERYLTPADFVTWSRFDVVLALPLRRARHAR
ncbi:MAG: helix-turn-helix domain-containing protein [Deltaproteobacteria bacterium]|nr:helix-turn-helix domain-containing protein [Deltaproteobacteria bacterium]